MKPPYPRPPFRIVFEVRDLRNGEITTVEDNVIAVRGGHLITEGNIPGVGPLDPEFCELAYKEEPPDIPAVISHDLEL